MATNVRDIINSKLQTLDRETGKGIFPEISREIVKGQKFLIVSYGGTGADALYFLKKTLEKNIDENELEKNVRLLCIDTDKNTPDEKVPVKAADGQIHIETAQKFTTKEFFWLENTPAKQAVTLDDAGMKPWVNPQLPAMIRADQTYLNGAGASSTRQIGRLLLFPQATVNDLNNRVSLLVRELTNDNNAKLKVFVISGISGGTGSGIVIDATYLIRHFIEMLPGEISKRTEICGFIMLPPTGTSKNPIDITKGNRNGVAALKEIDHYMTIAFRNENYAQQFGSTYINTTKNIFETCYLLDGSIGGVVFGNPREKANEVVSDCILDMITSLPITDQVKDGIQTVDSFMSDAAAYSAAMIRNQKEQVAPREANYVYSAIGHGKVLVPMELMKAYVAGNAFNKMYNLFRNCGNVSEDDVIDFIDRVKIPSKAFNEQAQAAAINEEIDNVFKHINKAARKGGPFYAINLLRDAAVECGNQIRDLQSKIIVLDKELKIKQLSFMKNYLLKKNDETFTVYVEVMEQMKGYFKTEHDVLCDSQKFQTYTGTTYTFTPIDFSALDEKSKLVRDYLDQIINNKRLDELTDKLIDLMISKRAEWTDVLVGKDGKPPRFKADILIRQFWQENIGKIVSSTIEDFLIKYYSGDMEACYKTTITDMGEEETEETKKWLDKAAEEIVNRMLGPEGMANPLAALREDLLTKDNFNGKNFFLVPKAAPHLQKYIEQKVQLIIKDKSKVIVAASYANDRISCYAQYTGIPAYMFDWTKNAEKDYEHAVSNATPGLHMSETKGGKLWRNYPNLIVESIWPKVDNPVYENKREQELNASVKKIFDMALALGLGKKHALAITSEFGYYHLLALPESNRPDSMFFKNVDGEIAGSKVREEAEKVLASKIEKKADELFKLVNWTELDAISKEEMADALKTACGIEYEEKSLQFTNTVTAAYVDAITSKPEGWEEILGAKLLRTCPEYMDVMRGTVMVMDRLYEKVKTAQQTKYRLRRFAQFLSAGLFNYSEAYFQWNYADGYQEKSLIDMEVGNSQQKVAEYYFMFKEFEGSFDEIENALGESFNEATADTDRVKSIEKQKAYMGNAQNMIKKVRKAYLPDKTNPDQASIITSRAYRELAAMRGYNVDEIVKFYETLEKNLLTI